MTIVVFTICTALALPAFASENDGFKQMFDGKTTKGWINPYPFGKATVEEGEIVLRGNPKFFLVTEKTYGDFILEAEVNVPVGGNSGIQARCHYKTNPNGKTRLWGYQAEVDTSDRKWAGGLYDEGRRGWLNPLEGKHEAQAAFKNGQWNHYRVEAIGDHLRFWVNGVLTTDYWDSVDIEGHIALQHHGEKGKTYRFRNVRIKELGKRQWEKIFDGKTLWGLCYNDVTTGNTMIFKQNLGTHQATDRVVAGNEWKLAPLARTLCNDQTRSATRLFTLVTDLILAL